jgi:hypothetical protein
MVGPLGTAGIHRPTRQIHHRRMARQSLGATRGRQAASPHRHRRVGGWQKRSRRREPAARRAAFNDAFALGCGLRVSRLSPTHIDACAPREI